MKTQDDDRKGHIKKQNGEHVKTSGYTPTLHIDVEKYQSYLDDANISDEQKTEMIEILWSIVVSFVDMGFGIHPVQQVMQNRQNQIQEEKEDKTEKEEI